MTGKTGSGRGLHHSISMILILFLACVIVLLVIGMLTGFAGLLHKTPLVAVRGSGYTTNAGADAIVLYHGGGDTVSLDPAYKTNGLPTVRFGLLTPEKVEEPAGYFPSSANVSWESGEWIVLYRDNAGFWITDNLSARIARSSTFGPVSAMQPGSWLVNITDARTGAPVAKVTIDLGSKHSI